MTTLRYLLSALALGAIADWASETFFWSAPPTPVVLWERLLTVLAYSACAGAALSAVLATGASGLRALFLGGAILGFLVEGVVVGTMYDAFPFQIIWTPLAWHALISGVVVLGFGRMAARLSARHMMIGWLAIGFFGGIWAQYWPLERGSMPGMTGTLAYLVGLGLVVPVANIVLDRVGVLEPPPGPVLLALPLLALLLWLAGTVPMPSVLRLSCPVMIALSVLAMRAGGNGSAPVSFGSVASPWKHGLFLIAPVTTSLIATAGWQRHGGLEVNIPVALGTGATALALWLWYLFRALRR